MATLENEMVDRSNLNRGAGATGSGAGPRPGHEDRERTRPARNPRSIRGWPTPPPGAARPLLLDVPASRWRVALEPWTDAPYRGDQVAHWVFDRGVFDFAQMANLPRRLRDRLQRSCSVQAPLVDRVFTSVDGTRRYLLELPDGNRVEAVWMPYPDRVTLCISSQVGCRFACGFCQTGEMGLRRSLTAGEIVGQVLRLRVDQGRLELPVNIVFMGQGEPLDNVAAVCTSLSCLQDERGPNLGWRRLTVSTVGIVPELRSLTRLGPRRPRLAVSLNATTDAVRSRLMPVNRRWPIDTLLAELRRIPWRRRERVTFEYVLMAGVNDAPEDAARLGRLLSSLPAKVNLIPWNPVAHLPFRRPAPDDVESFRLRALASGIDILVRYSRGADIAAACGQLHAADGTGAGVHPPG